MTEMNEAPEGTSGGGDGMEPLLKVRGIDKHFGPVQALYGVDLDLPAGQVTGLCGDNGAGKSVLTRCIAGAHQPDHGQIYFEGREVHIRSTRTPPRWGSRPSTRIWRWPTTWTSSRTCSSAGKLCAAACSTRTRWSCRRPRP